MLHHWGLPVPGYSHRRPQGAYLYADYCAADVRAIQVDVANVIDERSWDLAVEQVQSFGQDGDGELFVLLATGPVLKLVPADAADDED